MSRHPINLTLAFLLELAGLAAMAYWGWTRHGGVARFAWTIGLIVAASAVWGVFRVDGEPGKAPVPVHGIVRLAIELGFYAVAVWCLADTGASTAAIILGVITVVHYATSYDRIGRMVRNAPPIPPEWPALRR
jgi:hypothetical protein